MLRGLIFISLLAIVVVPTSILDTVAPNQRYQGLPFSLGFPDYEGSCIDEDMKEKII